VDWAQMFYADPSSPFLFNGRSCEEYNKRLRLTPKPPYAALSLDTVQTWGDLLDYGLCEGALEVASGGGDFPGLTLLQVPRFSTWDNRALYHPNGIPSGFGSPYRAAIICYTKAVYNGEFFCYPTTSNAVHELGHALGLPHQEPYPGGQVEWHEPQSGDLTKGENRIPATPGRHHIACVMGYKGCYGELCAKCALALRGWKIRSTTTPDGV
jgi:hypothetical protein